MSRLWHYGQNGQPRGPVSFRELQKLVRSGQLGPHDLVWQEGTGNWVMAGSVPTLCSDRGSVPADAPQAGSASGTDSAGPHTTADRPPAGPSAAPVFTRVGKRARRSSPRFREATSWLDIFDWKFQAYLTPWVVRITWIFAVSAALLWVATLLMVVAGTTLIEMESRSVSRSPPAAKHRSSVERPPVDLPTIDRTPAAKKPAASPPVARRPAQRPQSVERVEFRAPELPSWVGGALVRTMAWATAVGFCLIGLLWLRVVLETAIVIFNIANSLSAIERLVEAAIDGS